MRIASTITTAIVLLVFASPAHAQDNAKKAYMEFGKFMVGSWTPAGQEGARQHIYSWTLDKKFVRTEGRVDSIPWDGFCGIEPKSKKLTWWGFFADGTAGPIYLIESTDMKWVFEGDNVGPDGKTSRRVTITRTGQNSLIGKVVDTDRGNAKVIEETKWVRQR